MHGRLTWRKLARLATATARDCRGLAFVEFALALPPLLTLSLVGLELTNYSMAHMRVSQIALTTADNASRVRDTIDEADVNEVFIGVGLAGEGIDFEEKGLLILSSLQTNAAGDGQWIRWQRCFGDGNFSSSYGEEDDGKTNASLQAMGPAGRQVAALDGTSVMFVEVAYTYDPLIDVRLVTRIIGSRTIRYTAAFNVRARPNQDITNVSGATRATC